MARLILLYVVACFSIVAHASVSLAQKSVPPVQQTKVPLDDVMTLAKPYPNLRQSVRLALIEAGATKNTATCAASQLSADWAILKGRAVGPYRCKLGKRTLVINTAATYYDSAGHKIAADDARLPLRAQRVVEQRLVWSWQ